MTIPQVRGKIKGLDADTTAKYLALRDAALDEGYDIHITEGFRTFRKQATLYLQGRTRAGDLVTNALPGQSYHNFGRAFDITEDGEEPDDVPDGTFEFLGELAPSIGLKWGGEFGDIDHFENPSVEHPSLGQPTWEQVASWVGQSLTRELQRATSLGLSAFGNSSSAT